MSKRFLAVCSFLAATAISIAVPLFDEPIPQITLTTGEVLHNVQAKGFNSTSVLVKYQDGAKTVPYDHFPAQYRDILLARKPRPSAIVKAAAAPEHHADKPKSTAAAAANRLPDEQFKGLAIMSFAPGHDWSSIDIYNDNAETASVQAGAFQAELDNGKLVIGRHWVDTDEEGNINATLKPAQEIEPKSTVSLKVSFPVAPGAKIVKVVWSQN